MRVGVDAQPVVEVRTALEAHGDRYLARLFTAREIADCADKDTGRAMTESLAARFAAKEATLKALRVGHPVPPWRDIEVVREAGGWVSLRLHGIADRLAQAAGLTEFELSLTHTDEIAIAVVVAA